MKGSLVWRALKPTVTFTSTPKAAAPSSCQSRGGFPQLLAVENSIAAWPPGYSQPLQDLSWYQDLSPTFHSHSSCKRALASSTPAFFCFCFCPCPCGASCRILLQDSKALRWANTKPGYSPQGCSLALLSSGLLKPQGPTTFLPTSWATRNQKLVLEVLSWFTGHWPTFLEPWPHTHHCVKS